MDGSCNLKQARLRYVSAASNQHVHSKIGPVFLYLRNFSSSLPHRPHLA
jgi:hypothetical protein